MAFPEFQLLTYLTEGYTNQLKQKKDKKKGYSLIIPILLYLGKEKMKKDSFLDELAVPTSFEQFYPKFNFIKVDLGQYTDEQLKAIGETFLTSMLLLFKHKRDTQYLLQHYREI